MKTGTALILFLTIFAMMGAVGETQSGAEKESAGDHDPLFFIKTATDIATNLQGHSMAGNIGIYIDQKTWKSASNDGDLGSFVKVKEAKAGRSIACLFSPRKDAATCVYFDSDKPFGVVDIKADASGKMTSANITAAYKSFSKEMLSKHDDSLAFTPGDVNADDGQALTAFMIAAPATH